MRLDDWCATALCQVAASRSNRVSRLSSCFVSEFLVGVAAIVSLLPAPTILSRCTILPNELEGTPMPKAVLKNGVIYPLEPLPPEWADGRELRVESAEEDEDRDFDSWYD